MKPSRISEIIIWIAIMFSITTAIIIASISIKNSFDNEEADSHTSISAGVPAASNQTTASSAEATLPSGPVDIDISLLSGDAAYSAVYYIVMDAASYIGKTIRLSGTYTEYIDEDTGNKYYSCMVPDSDGCSAQGIEFLLSDSYAYPQDYPSEDDWICVTGRIDTYEEGDTWYCTLRDATYSKK